MSHTEGRGLPVMAPNAIEGKIGEKVDIGKIGEKVDKDLNMKTKDIMLLKYVMSSNMLQAGLLFQLPKNE